MPPFVSALRLCEISSLEMGTAAKCTPPGGRGLRAAAAARAETASTSRRGREVAKFLAAFAVAYGVNLAVLFAAQGVLGEDSALAQLPAISTYVVISFLLSQFVVFRPAASE